MKFKEPLQNSAVLIGLLAAFVLSNTGFAVDPDMQGLIIDNGTTECLDKHGNLRVVNNCDKEWDKLWRKLDRVDRDLLRLDNDNACKKGKSRKSKKSKKLCDHASKILVDLVFDAANMRNCCGINQEFEDQFAFLSGEFSAVCE